MIALDTFWLGLTAAFVDERLIDHSPLHKEIGHRLCKQRCVQISKSGPAPNERRTAMWRGWWPHMPSYICMDGRCTDRLTPCSTDPRTFWQCWKRVCRSQNPSFLPWQIRLASFCSKGAAHTFRYPDV